MAADQPDAQIEATEHRESGHPEPVWEVLTRRADGHETIHRLRAADESAALDAVEGRGVDPDDVVDVVRVAGP